MSSSFFLPGDFPVEAEIFYDFLADDMLQELVLALFYPSKELSFFLESILDFVIGNPFNPRNLEHMPVKPHFCGFDVLAVSVFRVYDSKL